MGLASVAVAVATEEAAVTAPSTQAPNAIDAAKRDYDAIKASKLSLEQQKLDLPKTGTPELRISDTTPSDLNLTGQSQSAKDKLKAAQRRGQKGTNWLVDAMLGDKDKTVKNGTVTTLPTDDADKTDAEETGELKLTDLSAKKLTTVDTVSRHSEKTAAAEEKAPPRVANPLDGFLAGWMTPGDYQLLKAAPEAGRGGAPASSLTPPTANPDAGGSRALVPQVSGFSGNPAPVVEPKMNPYLAEVAPPNDLGFTAPTLLNPSSSGPAPMPAPAPLVPTAAAMETPAPKPSAATPASDLIKARDDAKYFPQLKRF